MFYVHIGEDRCMCPQTHAQKKEGRCKTERLVPVSPLTQRHSPLLCFSPWHQPSTCSVKGGSHNIKRAGYSTFTSYFTSYFSTLSYPDVVQKLGNKSRLQTNKHNLPLVIQSFPYLKSMQLNHANLFLWLPDILNHPSSCKWPRSQPSHNLIMKR